MHKTVFLAAATLLAAACSRSSTASDAPIPSASVVVPMASSTLPTPTAHVAPTPHETTPTEVSKLGTLAPGTGIAVGQKVPAAHARDLKGNELAMADLLNRGPLLLAFYRGGWCPYCNFEIREMTKAFPEYQKRGVLPVAVSVDKLEEAALTNATYSIPFPVLSDPELSFIAGFHVENRVDAAMVEKMKSFGVDLERYAGKSHHIIAIPALFLIDKQGVVRWAHDDPTYTVRPTTSQILTAIDGAHLTGG
jgi:peroxiredoxin